MLLDARDRRSRPCPNGSVGFRYGEEGKGRWNLRLGDLDPVLTLHGRHERGGRGRAAALRRRATARAAAAMRRGVPADPRRRPPRHDGARPDARDLRRRRATGCRATGRRATTTPRSPYTPAWQEAITGVDRRLAVKVAREFARNAEVSGGRSMICMGAGTNHWFHSDETYRSFIALLLLCGCVGINGGGWAHYVGQEKIRTFAGWQTLAFALDWRRPPRQAQGTSLVLHAHRAVALRPAAARAVRVAARRAALFAGQTAIDAHAKAVRMGWMPALPDVRPQPARPRRRGRGGRRGPGRARRRRSSRPGGCGFAVDDPSAPSSFPRVFFVWRSNLLGSSGKGQEYFLRHLLGADARRAAGRAAAAGRAPGERALARGDPARQARPAGQRRLPHDDDRAVLGRRAAGGDLVREVRPVDDRHAPVRALVQPGGAAAVGGAHGLGRVRRDRARRSRSWPPSTSACAATSSRRRSLHDTPGRDRAAARRGAPTGARASASRCPGARCRR